jgi:hypothetical protein
MDTNANAGAGSRAVGHPPPDPVTAVPASPGETRLGRRGLVVYLTPVWVAVACGLMLFARRSDCFLLRQFWAEDGIFFMDARTDGIRSLWKPPPMGSQYLVQRLIAYAGKFVPVPYAPHFYNATAFALTLGVVVYIAMSRIDVKNKWLLALGVVFIPHYGEVFMNVTNVHWILALGLVIFLVSPDPSSRAGKVVEAAVAFIACLSGPFVLFFLPLFVIRAVVRRTAFSIVIAVMALICCWLQWLNMSPELYGAPLNVRDPHWLGYWGNSLGGVLLLGPDLAGRFPNNVYFAVLSLVLYAWLIAYTIIRRSKECATFLWAAGALLIAVAYANLGAPANVTHTLAFRYSYIPFVCTAWVLVVMLESSPRLAPVSALSLFLIGLSTVLLFRCPPLEDLHWQEACRCIGGPVPCDVPINPSGHYTIHYVPD